MRRAASCRAIALLAALAACGVPPPPPTVDVPRGVTVAVDPPPIRRDSKRLAGRWSYRTRSSCGAGTGAGEVTFTPIGDDVYAEEGFVRWRDQREPIRWHGTERYDPAKGTIRGRLENSVERTVQTIWTIAGPDTLLLHWTQSADCAGIGIATRGSAEPDFAVFQECRRCEAEQGGCGHWEDDGDYLGNTFTRFWNCDPWCCSR